MNRSMKFAILAAAAIISTFAAVNAKTGESGMKVEKANEAGDETLARDAGGATTEGASSDFDYEQLLKLIEAIKDQNFDGFEEMIKEPKKTEEPKNSETTEAAVKEEDKSEPVSEENKAGEEGLRPDL